ncbi:DUF3035 domain-containing protein [Roseovarius aestuariivivens]|uniref:DUF3035 domain-containing protein n=1 Tax=Roseovarius aestuariivivens TaxID=1888910 RepID=UPI0010803C77|nr:DUF3035 domain-containing protein [Roseovarius aestuariivivens]
MKLTGTSLLLIAALALSACGWGDREVRLTRFKDNGAGPDEFSILPGKPLQQPESYTRLPAPNPGGANLTDQNPLGDGVAALGGNPNARVPTGVSPADGALLNHTRRYGVTDGIRQVLAREDAETRRRYGRVNILNIGPNDDYTDAYRRQWLDSYGEARRLRGLGIATPSAPPGEPARARR